MPAVLHSEQRAGDGGSRWVLTEEHTACARCVFRYRQANHGERGCARLGERGRARRCELHGAATLQISRRYYIHPQVNVLTKHVQCQVRPEPRPGRGRRPVGRPGPGRRGARAEIEPISPPHTPPRSGGEGWNSHGSPRAFVLSLENAVCEDSCRCKCRRNRLLRSLPPLPSVRILTDSAPQRETKRPRAPGFWPCCGPAFTSLRLLTDSTLYRENKRACAKSFWPTAAPSVDPALSRTGGRAPGRARRAPRRRRGPIPDGPF